MILIIYCIYSQFKYYILSYFLRKLFLSSNLQPRELCKIDFSKLYFTRLYTNGEQSSREQIKSNPIVHESLRYGHSLYSLRDTLAAKWHRERSIVDDARIYKFLVSVSRSNVTLTRDKTTATIFQRTKKQLCTRRAEKKNKEIWNEKKEMKEKIKIWERS